MMTKDDIDLIVAIGTLLVAIFAGISAFVAAKSARETTKAVSLQREAIRAQSFIDILSYERNIRFSECMDVIRSLEDGECVDYEAFQKNHPEKDRQIRKAIDFINHLAHLMRHGYVTPRHFLTLYTPSIEVCHKKLLGQGSWLEGFRKAAKSPKYYLNFECLCRNLENLWSGKEIRWPDSQIQMSKEMRV
ncbi:MAG: hypothetical protein CVU57_31120 [Deltaproteobacteria bacterium HGW-Deltaproteobacteria-15]|jgi:hypothetical protein|nr:MAG: hypothetical protein CVU57_31120 [Deltaproteobacteria bacterium HGW-Deltaproteobacteria-15]